MAECIQTWQILNYLPPVKLTLEYLAEEAIRLSPIQKRGTLQSTEYEISKGDADRHR